jgi:hypothetical protein
VFGQQIDLRAVFKDELFAKSVLEEGGPCDYWVWGEADTDVLSFNSLIDLNSDVWDQRVADAVKDLLELIDVFCFMAFKQLLNRFFCRNGLQNLNDLLSLARIILLSNDLRQGLNLGGGVCWEIFENEIDKLLSLVY